MTDGLLPDPSISWRHQTRLAQAHVALRLARSLEARLLPSDGCPAPSEGESELARALAFARDHADSLGVALHDDRVAVEAWPHDHPLPRLLAFAVPERHGAVMRQLLADLVLLTCLPHAHEGLATLCRLVHPQQLPWPTATLALHWLEHEAIARDGEGADIWALRDAVEDLLCHGPAAQWGLLRTEGEGPWHGQTLRACPTLWPALMGRPAVAQSAQLVSGYTEVPGLGGWLGQVEVQQAVQALARGLPCHVLVVGGDAAMRHTRVRALLGAAGVSAVRTTHPLLPDGGRPADPSLGPVQLSAWLCGACLWLEDRHEEALGELGIPPLVVAAPLAPGGSMPVLSSAATERRCALLDLPQIRLTVRPLAPVARRALWQALLPQLGDQVPLLAARYPIEPDDARDVVRDLSLRQQLQGRPLALEEVGACVRARTAWHARPGITRVLPQADWSALLLPASALSPLQSAVRRITQQITVLDDWGFAQGRAERRGVRMLFYGPPGTGKTLAAEVMARALGVDLLVVDLASLVSKYIGETEKNLAAVFEVAERSRALLLFDEADALFGKRTDTQDAHDRYANLETAYLLQRLERYEGVAVLTTNLRGQLDKAFTRRFEAIVEFPEPDRSARLALWRLHLPPAAPLGPDVDLTELADWYAISGAQIKNAALAAAFLAAAGGQRIDQRHFLWAVEREFDKAGRAHPGYPPKYALSESGGVPLDHPAIPPHALI